jgi:hypothetical protein
MKVTTGEVIRGAVQVPEDLPDGTRVAILAPGDEGFRLSPEEETELEEALQQIRSSMSDQPSESEFELLRTAYVAFNSREIDAALATMTTDVAWPRAFKGGFVQGHRAVGAYWTEQWSEISPHVEPVAFHLEEAGQILVKVHQVVRDLAGAVLVDEYVGHRFTLAEGLIQKMEVCPSPSPEPNA